MPGAYAHITLVNEAAAPRNLNKKPRIPVRAKRSLSDWLGFAELGAVSPDYPYLVLSSGQAATWADTMHTKATGRRIAAGVAHVRELSGDAQEKCCAWLMGFAAHTFTDITIHPAVNLKVGPYEQNKQAHRICEMHQDAYIVGRLDYSDIGVFEHLDSGIRRCGPEGEDGGLDADIKTAWGAMLQASDAQMFADSPPDFDRWHNRFTFMVDNVAEEGGGLFPFARHLMVAGGLMYPARKDVDVAEYIENFPVPVMSTMHYDELFNRAVNNVCDAWEYIGRGIYEGDDSYLAWLKDYSLDTGTLIDPATGIPAENDFLFWR